MAILQLTGKNFDISETLRQYAEEKFEKLAKYADNITSMHVVLSVEDQHKSRNSDDKDEPQQIAKAVLHVPKKEIEAKEESGDMYKSIDLLLKKLERQLRRHKEKQTKHA